MWTIVRGRLKAHRCLMQYFFQQFCVFQNIYNKLRNNLKVNKCIYAYKYVCVFVFAYICMYVCILIHTHTHIYIVRHVHTHCSSPDENKKDVGRRAEVPRMAPFPHCLGPVGSALLRACPCWVQSPQPGPESLERRNKRSLVPLHPGMIWDTRMVCTGSQALMDRTVREKPHMDLCPTRETVYVCVGVEVWKTLRGAQMRNWTERLWDPGEPLGRWSPWKNSHLRGRW